MKKTSGASHACVHLFSGVSGLYEWTAALKPCAATSIVIGLAILVNSVSLVGSGDIANRAAGNISSIVGTGPAGELHGESSKPITNYIRVYGIKKFMEQCYNFFGTKREIAIDSENRELASFFNQYIDEIDLGGKVIRKDDLWHERNAQNIRRLKGDLAALVDKATKGRISALQRMFLKWHFLSPATYGFNLEEPHHRRVVGWNGSTVVEGGDDFELTSFGLVGCTAVIVILPGGSTQMSHFDAEANPLQISLVEDFLSNQSHGDVYVIGATATKFAEALLKNSPLASIMVHKKLAYMETAYSIKVIRKKGRVSFLHAEQAVSEGYIPSIQYLRYGPYFGLGMFGEIFPPDDDAFIDAEFVSKRQE